jgi:hypothetical protein
MPIIVFTWQCITHVYCIVLCGHICVYGDGCTVHVS